LLLLAAGPAAAVVVGKASAAVPVDAAVQAGRQATE
jgi:hypothetical protein